MTVGSFQERRFRAQHSVGSSIQGFSSTVSIRMVDRLQSNSYRINPALHTELSPGRQSMGPPQSIAAVESECRRIVRVMKEQ